MKVFRVDVEFLANEMDRDYTRDSITYSADNAVAAMEDAIRVVKYLEGLAKLSRLSSAAVSMLKVQPVLDTGFPMSSKTTIFKFHRTWDSPLNFEEEAGKFVEAFKG